MRGLRGLGIQGLANPVFSAGCPGGGLFNAIMSYNPIAYWPLNELSGTTAINYGSLGTAANGTYNGVTLNQIDAPGGGRAGLWDGANDFGDIYSAVLAGAFSGAAGTLLQWLRVYNAGVWTDGTTRKSATLQVDSNSFVVLERFNLANTFRWRYKAGGTEETISNANMGVEAGTGWFLSGITWNKPGDQVIAYLNSLQTGATSTGLGIWAGSLANTTSVIGAASTAAVQPFYGYNAQNVIYNSVLTQPQIAAIYAAGSV